MLSFVSIHLSFLLFFFSHIINTHQFLAKCQTNLEMWKWMSFFIVKKLHSWGTVSLQGRFYWRFTGKGGGFTTQQCQQLNIEYRTLLSLKIFPLLRLFVCWLFLLSPVPQRRRLLLLPLKWLREHLWWLKIYGCNLFEQEAAVLGLIPFPTPLFFKEEWVV